MTAKEYLSSINRLEVDIEAKIEQRARLRWMLRQAEEGGKEWQCLTRRMQAEDERLRRQIGRMMEQQSEIRAAIDRVPDETHRKILEYRYINGWSLLKISQKMYISYDWLRHLHGVALLEVQTPDE
mgnify:CR=1 FL=1